jgi:flagellar motor switch protein FliG
MSVLTAADLNPRQKAAIVVSAMGPDSRDLLKQLGGGEVELLAGELLQLGDVPPQIRDEILAEFLNRLAASQSRGQSVLERAATLLEATLGKDGAGDAVQRIGWRSNEALKTFVRRDPAKFAALIAGEHPQTVAFLLTQVEPEQSGRVIGALPADLQPEMAWRIATMGEISPDVAALVHAVLTPKVMPREKERVQRNEKPGGEQKAAAVLNMIPIEVQKAALENMASRNEETARRVRKLMFVFRDLLLLDDRAVQRVLKEVDLKDLSLALKKTEPEVKEAIFRNVSERAAVTIQEEMEYMSAVKVEDVEAAQDRIIERVRFLEEQGEIIIHRGESSHDALV